MVDLKGMIVGFYKEGCWSSLLVSFPDYTGWCPVYLEADKILLHSPLNKYFWRVALKNIHNKKL